MKIAYVLDDLDAAGGIQAVTRAKAAALAAVPGNEVVLVAANDARRTAADLPPGVRVVTLGVNYYEDDWKGFLYVMKGILVRRRRHAEALRKTLGELEPGYRHFRRAVGKVHDFPDFPRQTMENRARIPLLRYLPERLREASGRDEGACHGRRFRFL